MSEKLCNISRYIVGGNTDAEIADIKSELSGISAELSKKATTSDINTALNKKVNIADIINNLTSSETDKPLSAAQGNALNGSISKINSALANGADIFGYRGTSTNLNWALKAGVYRIDSSTTGAPSGINYGICFTLNNGYATYNGAAWFFQLAMSTQDNKLYYRKSINAKDGGGFDAWRSI